MATNTEIVNVIDHTTDKDGNEIQGLKYYGRFSQNAYVDPDAISFKSFGKIMRTTNQELSLALRMMYQKTFHDLRGVFIRYNPGPGNAPFVTEFYFAKNANPCPKDKIQNLVDLTSVSDKSNMFYKKQVVDNKANGHRYTLNEETKLLLSELMFGGKQANNPKSNKWNNYIKEVWVPNTDPTWNMHSGEQLVHVVGCFDFHKILQKIYGNTMVVQTVNRQEDDGTVKAKNLASNAAYEARFIKFTYNDPAVFIMNIEQFDKEEVDHLNAVENPIRRSVVSGVLYY